MNLFSLFITILAVRKALQAYKESGIEGIINTLKSAEKIIIVLAIIPLAIMILQTIQKLYYNI